MASVVQTAMSVLSDQERIVIMHRFGLNSGRILTLKEIGDALGISRERVRQIEAQAKTRLRKAFTKARAVNSPPKRIYPARSFPKLFIQSGKGSPRSCVPWIKA